MYSRLALNRYRFTPPGLPGSSIDLSTRAVPNHPGEPGRCLYPLLPCRCQVSPNCGGWPLSRWP